MLLEHDRQDRGNQQSRITRLKNLSRPGSSSRWCSIRCAGAFPHIATITTHVVMGSPKDERV
ncbi:MAG: hypothetical protein ACK5LJ_12480 [Paracoccus sp. (in: a-proteobacteria)]